MQIRMQTTKLWQILDKLVTNSTTRFSATRCRGIHYYEDNADAFEWESAAAEELAPADTAGASLGNAPLLSKLPAPRRKKRPILLTVLAESIPESDSDVSLSHPHYAF